MLPDHHPDEGVVRLPEVAVNPAARHTPGVGVNPAEIDRALMHLAGALTTHPRQWNQPSTLWNLYCNPLTGHVGYSRVPLDLDGEEHPGKTLVNYAFHVGTPEARYALLNGVRWDLWCGLVLHVETYVYDVPDTPEGLLAAQTRDESVRQDARLVIAAMPPASPGAPFRFRELMHRRDGAPDLTDAGDLDAQAAGEAGDAENGLLSTLHSAVTACYRLAVDAVASPSFHGLAGSR